MLVGKRCDDKAAQRTTSVRYTGVGAALAITQMACHTDPVNCCSAREENAMLKWPTSVSVVCWIIIATSGLSLVSITRALSNPMVKEIAAKVMSQDPIPIPLQYLMLYGGLLIKAISGLAMLRGKNWGRLLFVSWSIFGFITGFATSPMKMGMIPGLVLFIVFAARILSLISSSERCSTAFVTLPMVSSSNLGGPHSIFPV
jgi:hypothetical protein